MPFFLASLRNVPIILMVSVFCPSGQWFHLSALQTRFAFFVGFEFPFPPHLIPVKFPVLMGLNLSIPSPSVLR